MLVQGDETGDVPLVEIAKEYVKEKYQKPGAVFMGVVHRLDRPVSGVVVLARTSKALERMNELFRTRQTTKIYWALVDKTPPQQAATLVHWLWKDEKKNRVQAYASERTGAARSELSYQFIQPVGPYFLLEVRPTTGRSHQIRVQLASIGCSIVGDVKYGATFPNADASICLHARRLEFAHPVKKERMAVAAPAPQIHPWNLLG